MSFDAYEVAINLKLEDKFSEGMGQLADKLGESSKHAEELQKKLEKIGDGFKAAMAASVTGCNAAVAATDKQQ